MTIIITGRRFASLKVKNRLYVIRRMLKIPVYSATGAIMNAYRVKNTRQMRRLGAA